MLLDEHVIISNLPVASTYREMYDYFKKDAELHPIFVGIAKNEYFWKLVEFINFSTTSITSIIDCIVSISSEIETLEELYAKLKSMLPLNSIGYSVNVRQRSNALHNLLRSLYPSVNWSARANAAHAINYPFYISAIMKESYMVDQYFVPEEDMLFITKSDLIYFNVTEYFYSANALRGDHKVSGAYCKGTTKTLFLGLLLLIDEGKHKIDG